MIFDAKTKIVCMCNEVGSFGAPGHISFSVSPISCFWGMDLRLRDIPWVPKSRFIWLLIREGMQRPGRNSLETIVPPWGRVLVPPQGIYITVSLSSSTNWNPQQMEDINEVFFIPKEGSSEPILGPPKHQLWKTMHALIDPDPYKSFYFSLPNYKTTSQSLPRGASL